MMFRYPYGGLPYYNKYSRYGYHYPSYNNLVQPSYNKNIKQKTNTKNETPKNHVNSSNDNFYNNKANFDSNSDSPLFNMFGISLYFDDILLICLIFFLYNEGVEDEWLYIVLILLLLG